MRVKKIFTYLSIISLLSVVMLTGCSSTEETTAPQGTEDEIVEIVLSGWAASPEETALLEQTLKDFEAKYPNIKVKHDVINSQYMDVMKTRLIGGEAADVFYLDSSEAPALIETGVLEPLDTYIANTPDFDMNDYEKPLLEAFQADGKTYGLPKGYSTLGLFYNKKMFEEANLEVPTTFEEFREASKLLTKGEDVYGFGVAPELARMYYIAESKGGKVVTDDLASFADPRVIEGLQPIVDMHLIDKSIAQPSEVGASWGGEMFGQQKTAMVIEGNWAIPYLQNNFPELDFGIAEVPTIDGNNGTMAYTVSYVMNKDSKNKDAAWKLISYLTGKEGMETWTSKGFELPSRKSVAANLGYDQDELRGALVAGASYATVWQAGTNLPTINNNFNNQFVSAYLGDRPLDEALKEAEEIANKEIKANR